jgi:hypothetical protein
MEKSYHVVYHDSLSHAVSKRCETKSPGSVRTLVYNTMDQAESNGSLTLQFILAIGSSGCHCAASSQIGLSLPSPPLLSTFDRAHSSKIKIDSYVPEESVLAALWSAHHTRRTSWNCHRPITRAWSTERSYPPSPRLCTSYSCCWDIQRDD